MKAKPNLFNRQLSLTIIRHFDLSFGASSTFRKKRYFCSLWPLLVQRSYPRYGCTNGGPRKKYRFRGQALCIAKLFFQICLINIAAIHHFD